MDLDEIKEQINLLFNPEPEERYGPPEIPHPRLQKVHKLDFAYMRKVTWEGSSVHPYTRNCSADDDALNLLTRNSDMPMRLMLSAIHLFADSIVTYFGDKKQEGDIRFYPAIVLTLWSGFETFVKHSSEMLLLTVPIIPTAVRHFLLEVEEIVAANGTIRTRARYQPILDRYSVFIHYAYNYKIDKSNRVWQNLVQAKALRDYYTHLDMQKPRSITSDEVSTFIETTLLGLIWPSSLLQRTLLLGQYGLYEIWTELQKFAVPYRERPFFLDWHLGGEPYQFHRNFENVDPVRYPSVTARNEQPRQSAAKASQ